MRLPRNFLGIVIVLQFSFLANGQDTDDEDDDAFFLFNRFNINGFTSQTFPTGTAPVSPPAIRPGANMFPGPRPTLSLMVSNKLDPIAPCPPKPNCPPPGGLKHYLPDGTCNNPLDGRRGAVNHALKRLLAPDYADGIGKPRQGKHGIDLPTARQVSTAMQDFVIQKSSRFSQMLPFWGQYIVHDISSSPSTARPASNPVNCACGSLDPACHNIPIGTNDNQYRQEGKTCLPVVRSMPVPDACCDASVRQQRNMITSFLDGGTVYAGSQEHLDELLDSNSEIGKLKVASYNTAEYQSSPHHRIIPVGSQVSQSFARFMACPREVHRPKNVKCFVAGDERANENSVLSSMHTMFMRYHNLLVKELHTVNPHWGKEKLIQTARSILAATHQLITYKQFLPIILGRVYMKRFGLQLVKKGYSYAYDASYDASVSNAFSAAAFRFGHTLIPEVITRSRPNWTPNGPNILLKDSFFNAIPLLSTTHGGSNSIIRGITKEPSLQFDSTFSNDMRNFLFAPNDIPGRLGSDLLAINLQRGRDHGIPGYNFYRELAGLKKATDWSDFTEIPFNRRNKLRRLYKHVDNVDLYIGGISETSVVGGVVGPTFAYLIAHQFRDIKRGDRFWHENGGDKPVFTLAIDQGIYVQGQDFGWKWVTLSKFCEEQLVFQCIEVFFKQDVITYKLEQLSNIRKMCLSRLICDTMTGTRSIQPNPLLQATVRGNNRKSCASYPKIDFGAWREVRVYRPIAEECCEERTAWFPLVSETGSKLDPVSALKCLLQSRPDDVCHNVIKSFTRIVRGKEQISFSCPCGSIAGSDYPPSDCKNAAWTDCEDNSTPRYSSYDDDESRDPRRSCSQPIAIQVQTTDGVPARETGEVFRKFSPIDGFVCRGEDQKNGRCSDYRVRYLCKKAKKHSITTTPYTTKSTTTPYTATTVPPNDKVWTDWINSATLTYLGDLEFKYTVAFTKGFCNNPIRVQGRTVRGHRTPREANNRIRYNTPGIGFACYNVDQVLSFSQCADYEVRYQCRQQDINH